MNKNKLFIVLSAIIAVGANAQESGQATSQPAIPAPPESQAGQCHALVNVPAELKSKVENVVSKEAGEALEITPEKYEWVEKQVRVSEEEKTIEIIPATYKTIQESIVVEPARKEHEVIPAQYEEVKEKIMVKPAMRVWRKSRSGAASLNGEVMRLIEVPAKYQTITKKRIVSPPQIREVIIPEETAVVEKKIIDKPASVREIIIPPEYRTIRVKQLAENAKPIRTTIQPEFVKVTKQEIVVEAQLKWQRVPCDNDLNEKNIMALQKGLRAAGYDVTPDGKFGKSSKIALEKFQEKHGLAKGAITLETMKKLGVNIN